MRIGELSLGGRFDGVLQWGPINNRPFLRCMHGYGLCLWRLGRFDEAGRIFDQMLWLNPSDNQGVRFVIEEVRGKKAWEDCQEGWDAGFFYGDRPCGGVTKRQTEQKTALCKRGVFLHRIGASLVTAPGQRLPEQQLTPAEIGIGKPVDIKDFLNEFPLHGCSIEGSACSQIPRMIHSGIVIRDLWNNVQPRLGRRHLSAESHGGRFEKILNKIE